MKMNNKGFTLVELLAVITILLSLSIVVVTNVSASLKRNDEQKEETQINIAKTAAKIYFSTVSVPTTCVTRDELVREGFVDVSSIDKLPTSFSIKIGTSSYVYTQNGSC